jgi:hypothetical protein
MRFVPWVFARKSLLKDFSFKAQLRGVDNNEASGFINTGSHTGDDRRDSPTLLASIVQ